jgi:hypothetical protein
VNAFSRRLGPLGQKAIATYIRIARTLFPLPA